MLETCNENARLIQSLNSTILEFMEQMLTISMGMGSLQSKGRWGGKGLIVTQLVEKRKFPP
jgi:hypothetical protein